MHPLSKVVLFNKNEISIKSTVLNNLVEITPIHDIGGQLSSRHLYFYKIDESINLPIFLIIVKIIWKRTDIPNSMSKVLTGILDLNEIL